MRDFKPGITALLVYYGDYMSVMRNVLLTQRGKQRPSVYQILSTHPELTQSI